MNRCKKPRVVSVYIMGFRQALSGNNTNDNTASSDGWMSLPDKYSMLNIAIVSDGMRFVIAIVITRIVTSCVCESELFVLCVLIAADLNNVLTTRVYNMMAISETSELKQEKNNENGVDNDDPTIMQTLLLISLSENKPAKMAITADVVTNMISSTTHVVLFRPYPANGLITIQRNLSTVTKRTIEFDIRIDVHKSTPATRQ